MEKLTRQAIAKVRDEKFVSVAKVNERLLKICRKLNAKNFQKRPYSREYVFKSEKLPALKELSEFPYEYSEWKKLKVSYNYHVSFDKNYYSIPYEYVGQKVNIRYTDSIIENYCNSERIAVHKICLRIGIYSTSRSHMPTTHKDYTEWNSDKFKKWARSIGPYTTEFINRALRRFEIEQQNYKTCMLVLKLSKQSDDNKGELLKGAAHYRVNEHD